MDLGACGQVDRALDSRSEGLGFSSKWWSCVEVSGKVRIPHCLGPPGRNGYLVRRSKVGSVVAGCCAPTSRGGKVWRTCVATLISGLQTDTFTFICKYFFNNFPLILILTLKVLNFWKFPSYCSLKPLWSGMGEVVPARTVRPGLKGPPTSRLFRIIVIGLRKNIEKIYKLSTFWVRNNFSKPYFVFFAFFQANCWKLRLQHCLTPVVNGVCRWNRR